MITNNKLLLLLLTEFFCFWMIVIPASAALKDNWSYVDTEYSVASIVYGNERFAGFFDDHSVVSQDGYEWEMGGFVCNNPQKLIFCGDYFFAFDDHGNQYISSDGKQWTLIYIGNGHGGSNGEQPLICYDKGQYYAFVNGTIHGGAGSWGGNNLEVYCSGNGKDWSYLCSFCNELRLDQIFFAGDKLLGIGTQCNYQDEVGDTVFCWKDEQWEMCTKLSHANSGMSQSGITEIAYGDLGLIAVGNSSIIWKSADGLNWERETIKQKDAACFKHILFANHNYIAVTDKGELYRLNTLEANAIWKKQQTDVKLYQLFYGNGRIVAIGDDGIYINETGSSNNANLSSCIFDNAELSPVFQSAQFDYTLEIPERVTEISVTMRQMEMAAQLSWFGDDGTENFVKCGERITIPCSETCREIAVKVTAENGVTYRRYIFQIVRSRQYRVLAALSEGGKVTGEGYVKAGGNIELKAVPDAGYTFDGWYENGELYSMKPTLLLGNITNDRLLEARFLPITNENIQIVVEEKTLRRGWSYTIKSEDAHGIECDCEYTVLYGSYSSVYYSEWENVHILYVSEQEVTDRLVIQATLARDSSIRTTCIIPIEKQEDVENYWQVEAECMPENAGQVVGTGRFAQGQQTVLTAKAVPGYRFVCWQEGSRSCDYDEEWQPVYGDWSYDEELVYCEEDSFPLTYEYGGAELRFRAVFEKQNIAYLRILKKPQKLNYYVGECFQPEGMLVRAYYEDGSYVLLDRYSYTTQVFQEEGEVTIPVSYGEGEDRKTVELSVTVYSRPADGTGENNEENNEENIKGNNEDEKDKDEQKQDEEDELKNDKAHTDDEDKKTEEEKKVDEEDDEKDDEVKTGEEEKKPVDSGDTKTDDEKKGNTDNGPGENEDKEKGAADGNDTKSENEAVDQTDITAVKPSDRTENRASLTDRNEAGSSMELSDTDQSMTGDNADRIKQDGDSDAGGGGKQSALTKKQKISVGVLTYQITKLKGKKGEVKVTKAKNNITKLVIPAQIKLYGYTFQVTQIGDKAFYKQKRLRQVSIGRNVRLIGTNAFAKCKNLSKIDMKSTGIKKVGRNAFSGIAQKHNVTISKKCRKKYRTWIKKNHLTVKYRK